MNADGPDAETRHEIPAVTPSETPPETVACGHCGVRAATPAPLEWTSAVERGRLRHFCASCSRTHLRSMEAKLDSEWW